jgi:hypothetical protein
MLTKEILSENIHVNEKTIDEESDNRKLITKVLCY